MRREIEVITPDGKKIATFFCIYPPVQESENLWKCEVWIGEIFVEPKHAFGVDSWDAMQMATLMIYKELVLRKKFGWKFSWFDQTEDDLCGILPPLGRGAAN